MSITQKNYMRFECQTSDSPIDPFKLIRLPDDTENCSNTYTAAVDAAIKRGDMEEVRRLLYAAAARTAAAINEKNAAIKREDAAEAKAAAAIKRENAAVDSLEKYKRKRES